MTKENTSKQPELKTHSRMSDGLKEIMYLNVKLVYHPKYIIPLGILLPFMVTLSFAVLLPIWMGFIFCASISLMVTSASTFAALFFSYTEGTMQQNLNLTKGTKKITLISVWLSMLLTNLIAMVTIILTLMFLTLPAIDVAMMSFAGTVSVTIAMNWGKVSWSVIAYYWVMTTTIMFSVSLFVQRFTGSKKTYFVFLLSFMLFAFIFGGSMAITWGIKDDGTIALVNPETKEPNPFGAIASLMQGSPLWWICQFVPTFHINQFAYNALITGVEFPVGYNPDFAEGPELRLYDTIMSLEGINLFELGGSSAMWKYYFSMPYVNIFVYYILYATHEKYM